MLTLAAAAVVMLQGVPIAVTPNFWSREEGKGSCARVQDDLRIRHEGARDWSVELGPRLKVQAGDVIEVLARGRFTQPGSTSVSFVMYRGDEVVQWTAGEEPFTPTEGSQLANAKLLVPTGVTSVQPRLVGDGTVDLTLSSPRLVRSHLDVAKVRRAKPIVLRNAKIALTLNPTTLESKVQDRQTGATWQTRGLEHEWVVTAFTSSPTRVELRGLTVNRLRPVTLAVALDPKSAEVQWSIKGAGPMPEDVTFPGSLVATKTMEHVLPINMGVRYPAADPAIENQWLVGYGGHGLCMGFFGQLDQGRGVLNMIQTSDDFLLRLERKEKLLEATPAWQSQKGQFGYERKLRTAYFPKADLNTLAFRYREEAKRKGLLKTLREKAKSNPNVPRLAKAINLWTWDDKLSLATAAHRAGMRQVLWSGGGTPDELRAIRKLGFIAGRYDIYQDVMDPSKFPNLDFIHPDWVTAAWPNELVRLPNGDWEKGWVIQDKQGKDIPCGVVCDVEALKHARVRIPADLKTHPYDARFIDTTTASAYRECYDERHPMTRSDSRRARMELLQYVTDQGQVTGSETGHEASVPHLVYFEGMMSLGPYRVPDAGTNPPKPYATLPERVKTFQLGPKYRVPLWQLVYGDCTVSGWYWGDGSDKNRETWDLRDLWNILYGTPPLYFTDAKAFIAQKERYLQSYRKVTQALNRVAMHRMVHFRVLNPSRTVQQTEWDNGTTITVNLSDQPQLGLAPRSFRITPAR